LGTVMHLVHATDIYMLSFKLVFKQFIPVVSNNLRHTGYGKTSCSDFLGDRGTKTKICQRIMSKMPPCTVTERQIWSDYGWISSKTTEVFWKTYFVLTCRIMDCHNSRCNASQITDTT
jgi:hypothetical protein